MILLGGPGESAVDDASTYTEWLAPLLADRDLLLVDQRGAGGSSPLACPLMDGACTAPLLKDSFPPEAVRWCVASLSRRTDLTRYGYDDFAQDLEQVRQYLGYGPLNLFSGSYGTRAAQVFMRRYPKSTRTAFLGSVVPIDIATPATMAATAQTALEAMFAACAAEARCAHAFPNSQEQFAAILHRLDRSEVTVRVSGRGEPVKLHTAPVVAWVRSRLYRPSSAAVLPSVIHRAYLGDWSPIVAGIKAAATADLSFGLFFAITCNEDMPFITDAGATAAASGSFLGNTRVRQQRAACAAWPRSPLPVGYRLPVQTAVPTLFVTGEADGGTPIWFTDHAARTFTRKAIVRAPGQGHTEWRGCIASRYFELVRLGEISGAAKATCPAVPSPSFAR